MVRSKWRLLIRIRGDNHAADTPWAAFAAFVGLPEALEPLVESFADAESPATC